MADYIRTKLFWKRNILCVEWCVFNTFVVLDASIVLLSIIIVFILKGNLLRNIMLFIPGPTFKISTTKVALPSHTFEGIA